MAKPPPDYRLIGGHFPPEIAVAFNVLTAEQSKTNRAMLAEALDLLFAKYGKPSIALLIAHRSPERKPGRPANRGVGP